jgi:hypothetical protein
MSTHLHPAFFLSCESVLLAVITELIHEHENPYFPLFLLLFHKKESQLVLIQRDDVTPRNTMGYKETIWTGQVANLVIRNRIVAFRHV